MVITSHQKVVLEIDFAGSLKVSIGHQSQPQALSHRISHRASQK